MSDRVCRTPKNWTELANGAELASSGIGYTDLKFLALHLAQTGNVHDAVVVVGYVDEHLPYRITNPGSTRIRDEIAAVLEPVAGTAEARALGAKSTRTDIRALIATALAALLTTTETSHDEEAPRS